MKRPSVAAAASKAGEAGKAGKAGKAGTPKSQPPSETSKPTEKKRPSIAVSPKNDLMVFGGILFVVLCMLFPIYHQYGIEFFIPTTWQKLALTEADWQRDVLPNRTFIFIGGQHRGGTTLLWNLTRQHPSVGAFGTQKETGSDYSEGVFLQDVLPCFGIGQENLLASKIKGPQKGQTTGLGAYALGQRDAVWWSETNRQHGITPQVQMRLLNSWGYFWQKSGAWDKQWLLEKTPSTAVISRFLQALIDVGLPDEVNAGQATEEGSAVPWPTPRTSRTRFMFMNRHPLANALALKKAGAIPPLYRLIENWVAVSEYMENDRHHLHHQVLLRLEDLCANPQQEMARVWQLLGVDEELVLASVDFGEVRPNPNQKYEQEYCTNLATPRNRKIHRELRGLFGDRIRALGYDLDEWACTQIVDLVDE